MSYYGGKNIKSRVEKLPSESFGELVRDFISRPRQISITSEEYQALRDKKDPRAWEIKNGFYLSSCSFTGPGVERNDSNVEELQCLFIDIDDPNEARRLVEEPESVSAALPYDFALHHTISSTPEEPRCRLMVDVEPTDPKNRYALVRHVARLTGLVSFERDESGKVIKTVELFDKVSKVASQPAFQPVQFDQGHLPLITARVKGVELTMADVSEEDLDAEMSMKDTFEHGGDFSDLDALPIYNLDLDDVEEALAYLHCDEPHQWYRTICALKHQFRSPKEQEAAFAVFDFWSSTGAKYDGTGATRRKWRAYKADPSDRAPVTIRTVLKRAREAGWKDRRFLEKQTQGFEEWIAEQDNGQTVSEEGIKRIAATPFGDNTLLEEHYITVLYKKLKELKFNSTITSLRKSLKHLNRKTALAKNSESEDGKQDPWLTPFIYHSKDNEFIDRNTGLRLKPESFNNRHGRIFMGAASEEQQLAGRPAVLPTDYALNVKQIPIADGITYDPRSKKTMIRDAETKLVYYNEYRPPRITPDSSKSEEAGKILTRHAEILCGKKYAHIFLDFLAWSRQNPGKKMRWAIIIQSAPGAGKSMMNKLLEALHGEGNINIVEPAQVKERFNAYAANACVVIFEELRVAGENRFAIMNRMKQLITNDRISIEAKGKDIRMTPNTANVLAYTNEQDALALDDSDRRWCPIKSPLRTRKHCAKLDKAGYFEELARITEGDLVAGAVHFLDNYEVSEDFDPDGRAPITEFRQEMIEDSSNPVHILLEESIDDPQIKWAEKAYVLQSWFDSAIEDKHLKGRNTSTYLREMGYSKFMRGKTRQFQINGIRTNVWVNMAMPSSYDPVTEAQKAMREDF